MKDGVERGSLWSIVLAGGDGVWAKEFIRHRFGYETPKQYCIRTEEFAGYWLYVFGMRCVQLSRPFHFVFLFRSESG